MSVMSASLLKRVKARRSNSPICELRLSARSPVTRPVAKRVSAAARYAHATLQREKLAGFSVQRHAAQRACVLSGPWPNGPLAPDCQIPRLGAQASENRKCVAIGVTPNVTVAVTEIVTQRYPWKKAINLHQGGA